MDIVWGNCVQFVTESPIFMQNKQHERLYPRIIFRKLLIVSRLWDIENKTKWESKIPIKTKAVGN